MPMQKDQNPCTQETSVLPPAAEREGGKVAQQVCVTPVTLQLFTACPWLLRPARYLFLDPFFVETSVLSAHQFDAAFPLPVSVENTNQRQKSMYPQAMKKSIAFMESIFSAE